MACNSFSGLGRAMKEAGALGVIGYKRTVWLPLQQMGEDAQEMVKRCINSGIIYWIQNDGNVEEVCNVVKSAYNRELQRLDEVQEVERRFVWLYGVLRSNMGSLGCL